MLAVGKKKEFGGKKIMIEKKELEDRYDELRRIRGIEVWKKV
jgi:hypothetical protein